MPASFATHPAQGPRRKAALALDRAASRLAEADAHHKRGEHETAHEVAKEAHTLLRRAALQLHEAQRAHEEYTARDSAGGSFAGGASGSEALPRAQPGERAPASDARSAGTDKEAP